MKKLVYVLAPVLALVFFLYLGFAFGFGAIDPWVWACIAVLFVSSALLILGRWYGSVGGLIVGGFVIWMGTRYTGQVVNEMFLGIPLFLFYLGCGILVYKKSA